MQLGVKKTHQLVTGEMSGHRHLGHLAPGEEAILETLEVEPDLARRLMELGFLPGTRISQGCCAPGGDPRVFRVDGSEIALRRETYERLTIRHIAA